MSEVPLYRTVLGGGGVLRIEVLLHACARGAAGRPHTRDSVQLYKAEAGVQVFEYMNTHYKLPQVRGRACTRPPSPPQRRTCLLLAVKRCHEESRA